MNTDACTHTCSHKDTRTCVYTHTSIGTHWNIHTCIHGNKVIADGPVGQVLAGPIFSG